MLYISWFSLQLPLYWLSLLLPRTLKNKSNFTFNCPLKFLLLCPVLIFGLNHIQLFRESESSLKFLISVLGLSRCWHQSLFILMMIIIIGTWSRSSHVFSADAGSLLSRNPESFSGTRRAGGQAGLVWASQPSSVQPPVKTSTQTQSRARHLLLSTLRLSVESRMGRKCGNFLINRLTGDSLPHMIIWVMSR